MATNSYKNGLGNAASYQVAALPFISGAIDLNAESAAGTVPFRISFPYVTQWLTINNHDPGGGNNVFMAFVPAGLPSQGGTNHIKIIDAGNPGPPNSPPPLYWKVSEIWIEGTSGEVDIVAGLNGISPMEIFENWSGSSGVG
mgnify:CR=1 FL=1